MLQDLTLRIVVFVACAAAGLLGIWALSGYYKLYLGFHSQIEGDRWMMGKCSDPDFLARIRAHTSVCADVLYRHQAGAALLAWRAYTEGMSPLAREALAWATSWRLLVPLAALCAFGPAVAVASSRQWTRNRHALPYTKIAGLKIKDL